MKINTSGAGNLLTNAMFYILEQKNREKEAARKSQEEAARQQSERQWQENNMLRENALADQRRTQVSGSRATQLQGMGIQIPQGVDLSDDAVYRSFIDQNDSYRKTLTNENAAMVDTAMGDQATSQLRSSRRAAAKQVWGVDIDPGVNLEDNQVWDSYDKYYSEKLRTAGAGNGKDTTVPSPQTQSLAENIKRRLRAEFAKGNLEGYTQTDNYIGALSTIAELSPDLATDIQNEYFTLAGQEPPAPPTPVKKGLFSGQPKMPVRSYPPAGGGTTIGTR